MYEECEALKERVKNLTDNEHDLSEKVQNLEAENLELNKAVEFARQDNLTNVTSSSGWHNNRIYIKKSALIKGIPTDNVSESVHFFQGKKSFDKNKKRCFNNRFFFPTLIFRSKPGYESSRIL